MVLSPTLVPVPFLDVCTVESDLIARAGAEELGLFKGCLVQMLPTYTPHCCHFRPPCPHSSAHPQQGAGPAFLWDACGRMERKSTAGAAHHLLCPQPGRDAGSTLTPTHKGNYESTQPRRPSCISRGCPRRDPSERKAHCTQLPSVSLFSPD